jgi:hypothetical protein
MLHKNDPSGLIKPSSLTASGMVLHAFPSMFVSFYTPLREFSEHGVYKHMGGQWRRYCSICGFFEKP